MRLEDNVWAADFPFHDEDPRNVSQLGLVPDAEPMLSQSSVLFLLLLFFSLNSRSCHTCISFVFPQWNISQNCFPCSDTNANLCIIPILVYVLLT